MMSNQAQGFRRDNRFQKGDVASEMYQSFLEEATKYNNEDVRATTELV
jgi:hypothetical protein